MDFYVLAKQCSPQLEKEVVAAISHTESTYNPFAIGVVGGAVRQPTNYRDAVLTVRQLQKDSRNFSVGITQVNKSNFARYGLNESNMFDPCTNIRAGASIFKSCLDEANAKFGSKYSYDGKLRLAASCYYSGNFTTGFKRDFPNQPPYVDKFYNNLLVYRGIRKTPTYQVMSPGATAPLTQQPTTANSPSQVVATQKPIVNPEYQAIVDAIRLQNQGEQDNNEVAVSQPLAADKITDSFNEAEKSKTWTGDVFAAPSNDLFSKQSKNLNRGV